MGAILKFLFIVWNFNWYLYAFCKYHILFMPLIDRIWKGKKMKYPSLENVACWLICIYLMRFVVAYYMMHF